MTVLTLVGPSRPDPKDAQTIWYMLQKTMQHRRVILQSHNEVIINGHGFGWEIDISGWRDDPGTSVLFQLFFGTWKLSFCTSRTHGTFKSWKKKPPEDRMVEMALAE